VAKPDLVAPGNRIVSLRAPGSYDDLLFPDRRVAADPNRLASPTTSRCPARAWLPRFVAGTVA
jgi:hypothetical protein